MATLLRILLLIIVALLLVLGAPEVATAHEGEFHPGELPLWQYLGVGAIVLLGYIAFGSVRRYIARRRNARPD